MPDILRTRQQMRLFSSFLLALFVCAPLSRADAPTSAEQVPGIFYTAIHDEDYATAWALITEADRDAICEQVAYGRHRKSDVRRVFDNNEWYSREFYWNEFRGNCDFNLLSSMKYSTVKFEKGVYTVKGVYGEQTLNFFVKKEDGLKYALTDSIGN